VGLKERYVYTHRRRLGTSRELLVENALKLLGFHVERVGLGVAENGYIRGWSAREDAFDLKVSRLVGPKIYSIYVEVTGCSLTLEQSRRILRRLLGLNQAAVLVQRSKLEKYEKYEKSEKYGLPVAVAHVWDPLLRIDWAWMEEIKHSVIRMLRLAGEPTPYLVVSLDIWKPITRLPNEIAHPPLTSLADLIPRKRRLVGNG